MLLRLYLEVASDEYLLYSANTFFMHVHQQVVKWTCKKFMVSILNVLKFWTPKSLKKITYANSADIDQTAPEGAVWSGSTLFAIPLGIVKKKNA